MLYVIRRNGLLQWIYGVGEFTATTYKVRLTLFRRKREIRSSRDFSFHGLFPKILQSTPFPLGDRVGP
jgi:hypothetical protein